MRSLLNLSAIIGIFIAFYLQSQVAAAPPAKNTGSSGSKPKPKPSSIPSLRPSASSAPTSVCSRCVLSHQICAFDGISYYCAEGRDSNCTVTSCQRPFGVCCTDNNGHSACVRDGSTCCGLNDLSYSLLLACAPGYDCKRNSTTFLNASCVVAPTPSPSFSPVHIPISAPSVAASKPVKNNSNLLWKYINAVLCNSARSFILCSNDCVLLLAELLTVMNAGFGW